MSDAYSFLGAKFVDAQNKMQQIPDGVWDVHGPPQFDMISIDFGEENKFIELSSADFSELVLRKMAVKQPD